MRWKIAFLKYQNLKELRYFRKFKKTSFCKMTGSGSVIITYYLSKNECELAKVQFKRKFKNIGVIYQKLYKNYFVLYEFNIGRSCGKHWFLVPAS